MGVSELFKFYEMSSCAKFLLYHDIIVAGGGEGQKTRRRPMGGRLVVLEGCVDYFVASAATPSGSRTTTR